MARRLSNPISMGCVLAGSALFLFGLLLTSTADAQSGTCPWDPSACQIVGPLQFQAEVAYRADPAADGIVVHLAPYSPANPHGYSFSFTFGFEATSSVHWQGGTNTSTQTFVPTDKYNGTPSTLAFPFALSDPKDSGTITLHYYAVVGTNRTTGALSFAPSTSASSQSSDWATAFVSVVTSGPGVGVGVVGLGAGGLSVHAYYRREMARMRAQMDPPTRAAAREAPTPKDATEERKKARP